jgi:hypothetical protein
MIGEIPKISLALVFVIYNVCNQAEEGIRINKQDTHVPHFTFVTNISFLCNTLPHPREVAASDLSKSGVTNPHSLNV